MRSDSVRVPLMTLAVAALLAACGAGPGGGLETRTFRLEYLHPEAAIELIGPYVFTDGSTISEVEGSIRAITVRERPDVLERIGATIAEYDRPRPAPAVRLRFQLIEADGFEAADPAIAEVEKALHELFRFDGYRLLAESVVSGARRLGEFEQHVAVDAERYQISGQLWEIHDNDGASGAGGPGAVTLDIRLVNQSRGEVVLEAEVSVPTGQTVVLGNGQTSGREGTLILTVRPEIREGEG